MKERWSNDGTFDMSSGTEIGKIKSITPNMEFSFELKIENMDGCTDSCRDIGCWCFKLVLGIGGWFDFNLDNAKEESKFLISHDQKNGLGYHYDICKQNPITFTKNWQKEFLLKNLDDKIMSFKYGVFNFILKRSYYKICKNFKKYKRF